MKFSYINFVDENEKQDDLDSLCLKDGVKHN